MASISSRPAPSPVPSAAHLDASDPLAAFRSRFVFSDPELVEPFCRLLHDPDWWIRITVCDSLARLGDDRAVPKLIEVLGDHPDLRLRG